MKTLPVIHVKDFESALKQAALAVDAGADGIFFISHDQKSKLVVGIAAAAKFRYPDKLIGINLLGIDPLNALKSGLRAGLDMVWADECWLDAEGGTKFGALELIALVNRNSRRIKFFGSVAFKYQPIAPDPAGVAKMAHKVGFIPTTSGAATGEPPTVDKITSMAAVAPNLAVASGLDPQNIHLYAPHIEYALVATGVSHNFHELDFEKLSQFIALGRQHSPDPLESFNVK